MALRVGRRVFAPGRAATLATLALLPLFIALGGWQLQRADEKRELMTQAAAGRERTLALNAQNLAKLQRYQQVSATGRYDGERQILLDNMPSHSGQAGYRVLTPLSLADGAVLLVDRGWVPLGSSRETLPNIAVEGGERTVLGLLDELPEPGVRLGAATTSETRWPRVLNYPRRQELAALYGPRLLPRIVLLNDAEPDGYERQWRINSGFGPERHIGYAVQWFAMALTLAAIYIGVNLKRVEIS